MRMTFTKNNLQPIWEDEENRNKISQFTSFELTSTMILRGTRRNENKQTTILAYCGGKIKQKGKKEKPCAYTPLVIGRNPTCPECGFLVCKQTNCDYCSSKSCPGYIKRKNKNLER